MCCSNQTAFLVRLLALCIFLQFSIGDIVIINQKSNETEKVFIDFELSFSAPLGLDGIEGIAVVVEPDDGCEPIKPPPFPSNSSLKWFALIKRKRCSLEEKVINAQLAEYGGAIIYNVGNSGHLSENADSPRNPDIKIPGVLIGEDDGRKMAQDYVYPFNFLVVMNPDSTFNLSNYLLPFIVVIGVCFLIMLVFMIVKCIKDRRRNRRNRLSSRHLKHLEVKKFKRGDKYDVCAVCLDEYCEGEKLRILPCSHAYHTKCIDPWLTNNRRNCPICKRKVAIEGVTDSDSESDSPSERTPLLQSNSTSHDASGSRERTTTATTATARRENSMESNEEPNATSNSATEQLLPAPPSKFSRFRNSVTSTTRAILHGNRTVHSTTTSSSSSYGSVSSLIEPSSSHSINFEDTVEAAEVAEGGSVAQADQIDAPISKQRKHELVV